MATIEEGTIQISSSSGNNNNRRKQNQNPKNRKEKKSESGEGGSESTSTEEKSKASSSPSTPIPKIVHYEHPLIKEHISTDPEDELCFICSDPIKYRAHYPCGHISCSKCSLRLRALIKDRSCTLCRKLGDTIIISENKKPFEQFSNEELIYKDEKHGILFDDREIKDKVMNLLKLNCPVRNCDSEPLTSWKELKKHVQSAHNKLLCEICSRHKTAFTVELEYYTRQTLSRHERDGDDRGFKGHPQCEFCRTRFYSADELFAHCREKHEKCFICERDSGTPPQYYRDYERLEKHFEDEHYVCQIQSCKDQKFVVFGTKVELQDHMVSQHSEIVGKSKAARRVEIDFGFSRGGGNGGFGSQLSTIPVGAASSGRRAETGNGTSASVVANTSSTSNPPSRSTTPSLDPESFPTLRSTINNTPSNSSSRLPANVSSYHANLPPSDNSPEILKRRLEERARLYLSYDTSKMTKFKELNTKFKDGQLDSKMIVFEYSKLFDVKPSQLELLIQELAALYKNLPAKKGALISAFETWKAKQAFPALGSGSNSTPTPPGLSQSLPGSKTNLASSWVSSNRTPGSVKTSLVSSQEFPSLLAPSPKKSPVTTATARTTTPPVRPAPTSASLIGASRVIPRSTTNASTAKLSSESFPSLPTSKSKKPPPVRVTTPVSTPSIWTDGASASSSSPSQEDPPLSAAINASKKKGKGKQILFRLGAFES